MFIRIGIILLFFLVSAATLGGSSTKSLDKGTHLIDDERLLPIAPHWQAVIGNDLGFLEESQAFDSAELGRTVRRSRINSEKLGPLHTYAIKRFVHKRNHFVIYVFYTFRDEDDGGNTRGWIEDTRGDLIAKINDSDFYRP